MRYKIAAAIDNIGIRVMSGASERTCCGQLLSGSVRDLPRVRLPLLCGFDLLLRKDGRLLRESSPLPSIVGLLLQRCSHLPRSGPASGQRPHEGEERGNPRCDSGVALT